MKKEIRINVLGALPIIFLFFVLVVSSNTGAEDKNETGTQQSDVKRSCIQSVDGYAYLSEDMTLSETRIAAFLNAKRQAVEMAKTYIQSNTVVENFELKKDRIDGKAEGAVTILEQKDLGVEGNSRYHVWIKAEVEYIFNHTKTSDKNLKSGVGTSVLVMDKTAPLTIKVWTLKKHYNEGENIKILLQGNRDFYARIIDVTSEGDIIQLLPNDYRKTAFFKAGKIYRIPDKEDRFDLKVSPPFGQDRIIVYASEVPLGKVDMESIGQGLNRYTGSTSSFAAKTRGISVSPAKVSKNTAVEFFEATTVLTTSD